MGPLSCQFELAEVSWSQKLVSDLIRLMREKRIGGLIKFSVQGPSGISWHLLPIV